jgi:two-component system phosphate regulon sensor histidine kinase PhoR
MENRNSSVRNHRPNVNQELRSFDSHRESVTNGQVRAVSLLIFIIFIGIFSVYSLAFHLQGDLLSFHNLQLSASLLAGIASIMSLIKYYTRRDDKYLFIGIGFLGASILKGLQSIPEAVTLFADSERFIYIVSQEGWGFSRFFVATMLSVSLIPWFLDTHILKTRISQTLLNIIIVVCLIFIFIAFAFIPLPFATFFEAYASAFFTFSLLGYLLKGLWKEKYFEYCLVLGLLIGVIAGIVNTAALGTNQNYLILAQLLETLEYSLFVVGLLISMYIAYKEVEEAKDNTNAILKSIGDGVFVVDNQGIVVLMNKIAERLSGIAIDHAMGKHYYDVFHLTYEENPHKPFPHIVEKILSRQDYREDPTSHPVIHNMHGDIPIMLNASPVKDYTGKIIGCVVVMIDMSKLREIERSKDNFLSLAAHQLGSPLGAVRWYTEMLLSGDMGKLTKGVKDTVSQIEENNQRMVDLVNKLLDVSRIDQKSVRENPKSIQFEKLIEEVIKNLSAHAFQKQIHVSFTPSQSSTTPITFDPDLMREVLTNIIANGIKYNKKDGSVHVMLEEKKDVLEITIKDTGIGIPKSDQDKIYSKFFRASNARKKETDGSGLGLFVAKSYLESWGGSIDFESKEEVGTTFVITIPKKPTLYALSAHLVDFDHTTEKISASKRDR